MTGTAPTNPDADAVERAVARLTAALDEGRPVAPVRDLIGDHGLAAAYAVQRELTRRRSADSADSSMVPRRRTWCRRRTRPG